MRALVQRVHWAEVEIAGRIVGMIRKGLLVYAAVGAGDTAQCARQVARKIATLRIFPDREGRLNMSLHDVGGGILAISNFTLLADAGKGRRPALGRAAPASAAREIHDALLDGLRECGVGLATGAFGADMTIRSAADGPVNIVIDLPGDRAAGAAI